MTLNLASTIPSSDNDSNTGGDQVPATSSYGILLAHAVIACIGFLVLLPVGALIPRFLRTFVTGWFKFHWIVQFLLGMSLSLSVADLFLMLSLGR
jgi:glycopeptide antibiotics resistance protein